MGQWKKLQIEFRDRRSAEPFLNARCVPGTELRTTEHTDLKQMRKLRLRNVRLGDLLPTCDVTVGSVIISLGPVSHL